MRTNNDINTLFQPLEDVIKQTFIPAKKKRKPRRSDRS